ncbi:hypothetical protein [Candidatus Poriferisocius sp.]|uniref:hypothetical protein n=1 Tax=Candidatus Poriferisocius sp. TaxID=3101276 RepID=UPI003B51F18E
MKIEVTQDHIDTGLRRNCHQCPVALAISDVFPGSRVNVGGVDVDIVQPDFTEIYFCLPEKVEYFIMHFDRGLTVKPFTFAVEPKEGENA